MSLKKSYGGHVMDENLQVLLTTVAKEKNPNQPKVVNHSVKLLSSVKTCSHCKNYTARN